MWLKVRAFSEVKCILFILYSRVEGAHTHFFFLLWLQRTYLKDRLCLRVKIVYKKHLSALTMFLIHNHIFFYVGNHHAVIIMVWKLCENKCRNLLFAVMTEITSVLHVLMSFFNSKETQFTVHSIYLNEQCYKESGSPV